MLKVKNFLKTRGIIFIVFLLVISSFCFITPTYAVMPTPHPGMELTNYGGNYRTIGFTLIIGPYTTAISRESSAILKANHTEYDPIGDGEHNRIIYSDGNLILRCVHRINYNGSIRWFWLEVLLMPSNFDSSNPVLGRSLLDNMLLESPEAYNYVQNRLYNYQSTIGYVNAINAFYDRTDDNRAEWPAMKANALWRDGISAFVTFGTLNSSNPILYPAGEIYCTDKIVEMAKKRGMTPQL